MYVSLHQHSAIGSPGDAIASIDALVARAAQLGMPAAGLTDHGRVGGWPELSRCCTEHGIKPLFGCELYVAEGNATEHLKGPGGKYAYHLCAWAKNETGLKNLIELNNYAHTYGFWNKPRVGWEQLERHADGLLISTACLGGEVALRLKHEGEASAVNTVRRFMDVFGQKNVYVELQPNGISDQLTLNHFLVGTASKFDLPLIVTNDTHYVNQEDWKQHDLFLAIAANTTVSDTKRKIYKPEAFFLRTPAEMAAAFKDQPLALRGTFELAERCDARLPTVDAIKGTPEDDALLTHLAVEGARRRYGQITAVIQERLDRELRLIAEKGFGWYFLKVAHVVQEAKKKGILIAPGRGSAVGSLVVYALGITDVDPLQYGLLFERFLNPGRNELPDIDIDVQADRRHEIIPMLDQDGSVLGLTTYSSIGYRKAVGGVAGSVGVEVSAKDAVLKALPMENADDPSKRDTLFDWFRANIARDCTGGDWFANAGQLYGTPLYPSRHASGFVIVPPAWPWAPLQRGKDGHMLLQYDNDAASMAGFTKFDFLNSKVLEVLSLTNDLCRTTGKPGLRFDNIPVDDARVFSLLSTGHTAGLFQLESSPMQELIRRVKPASLSALSDVIALYRPGPLQSGMVEQYVQGVSDLPALHPIVAEIVRPTRGIVLYQEQVIELVHRLGGMSLARADDLRRAMAKKKPEAMRALLEEFYRGAVANGLTEIQARDLADKLQKYSGYAYNRSHSMAYAKQAVATAFALVYAPAEFMAARLELLDDRDRLQAYLSAAAANNLRILAPCVNASGVKWTPESRSLRFGLAAIKGIGVSAAEAVVRCRGDRYFSTVADFALRISADARLVNRKVVIALIESGAFDVIQADRQLVLKQFDFARGAHRRAAGKGTLNLSLGGEIDRLGVPLSAMCGGGSPPAWKDRGRVIDNLDQLTQSLGQVGQVAVILNDAFEKKTRDGRPFWLLNGWLDGTLVPCVWWQNQSYPFDYRLPKLNPGQRLLLWAEPRERNGAVQLSVLAILDIA
ncbi:MAG: DNA polymerase III subunit alpha [Planctomycetota bacterium]